METAPVIRLSSGFTDPDANPFAHGNVVYVLGGRPGIYHEPAAPFRAASGRGCKLHVQPPLVQRYELGQNGFYRFAQNRLDRFSLFFE